MDEYDELMVNVAINCGPKIISHRSMTNSDYILHVQQYTRSDSNAIVML